MGEKYSGSDVLDLMKSAKQYNNYLSSLCEELVKDKNVKIVDFGAGIGTISEILAQKGFNIECIELDDEQRQVIQNRGLNAHEDLAYLDDSSVDMFISFNVFEHIKNDKELMKNIYNKLRQGGKFLFFVPAFSCLYSSFDKRLGHCRRYDLLIAKELVEDCGFTVNSYRYFDSLGFCLALVYKIFNRNGQISKYSINMYDKIIFPLTLIFDKIFNKYFGKNIVMVLSKD